ncbi:MAG: GIY-YIG nuclease superfamily protein [Syntrophorhabdus sp. PtaU1.Bin050]|nr:MAG: GIY-YIG nuclease superfamily protein [Syntrophorhabdus sp. PtaU1.Bin050]
MVKGKDGKIYTGISTDVSRRLDEHQACGTKGAKFLRGRGPLKLLIAMEVGDRSQALRVEYRVKQLKQSQKEDIIRQPAILKVLIEREITGRDKEASERPRR